MFAQLLLQILIGSSAIIGAVYLLKENKFIKSSIKTKAQITSIEAVRSGEDSYIYKTSVVFQNQFGEEVQTKLKLFKNQLGAATKAKFGFWITKNIQCDQDDEVEILFSKEDPQKIKFNSWFSLHVVSINSFGLALLIILILANS